MLELKNKNIRNNYITQLTRQLFGDEPESVVSCDGGLMNYVYRATVSGKTLYFKQGLGRAKRANKLGRDLASISPDRIKFEKKAIETIRPLMPPEIVVPRIYHFDEENNVLVTGDVSSGGVLLQKALLKKDFNAKVAANIGKFLALCHTYTFGRNMTIRDNEKEDLRNWEIFLNMRTKGIETERPVRLDLTQLYKDVLQNHTSNVLINMDCCPKNIFQRADGSVGFIDFELASGCGDPAYDVGFILGHYFLFAVLAGVPDESVECFRSLLDSYVREFENIDKTGRGRIIKYAGAVLLYRTSGASKADYIPADRIEEFKAKGSAIVNRNIESLDDAVEILKTRN